MEGPRWEALRPGGLRFVYGNGQHPPGLDSFLLASLPKLKPGWKVCDLGCGTGLLGLLLLQRQRALAVTGLDIQPEAVRLGKLAAAENRMEDRLFFRLEDLLEDDPIKFRSMTLFTLRYVPEDPVPWGAEAAYRRYYDEDPGDSWLLVWPGRTASVSPDAEPADTQKALISARLAPEDWKEETP